MRRVQTSEDEHKLLKEYLRTSPLVSIRARCQAILMREKKMSLSDIGDIVSREEHAISRWIKDWENRRIASIFSGHQENENASKLTKEQRNEIKEALKNPPSHYGLPKEFWDIPSLRVYTEAKFDTVYESDRSYHCLLKFSNLSFKYPDTFDFRRDDAKIEKRILEIKEQIKPCLEDPNWEVFTCDEVRIELEALTRRAWFQRGKRTIVKVNRKREAQSYLGCLNQKTFVCHTYEMPWQNQEEVIKALEKFSEQYPNKKLCIIWDNASFHKGTKIREALSNGKSLEHIHLIALPPYAPDKNPTEHIWNEAKGSIANTQFESFAETRAAFENYICSRKFEYRF
ncbi:MAG: IS630 family transposase [Myxococcaceae bacterium]